MVSFDQITWMWSNGEFVEWREASVHVSTHTLHLGSGVFEALRCYETNDGPAVFRLDAHLDRLYASASIHSIDIPYSHEDLSHAVLELIRYNDFSSCYIRMLAYHGTGSLGVMPHNCPVEVAILAWPFGAYLGSHALEHGVRVTISPWVKFSSRMMPTTAKACGQYLNSLLAVRAAIKDGYDEAILLNESGTIAEGSGENIFLVRDGRVITNDETSSILLGITRDAVIRIARDLGYDVEISPLRVEDLLSADEAFFTGTAAEVTPIREVDGKSIGRQERGPITHAIQQAFFNATSGKDPRYQHWLQSARQPAAAAVRF